VLSLVSNFNFLIKGMCKARAPQVGYPVVSGTLLYWFIINLEWKGSVQVRCESTTDPGLRKGQQAVHFPKDFPKKRSHLNGQV